MSVFKCECSGFASDEPMCLRPAVEVNFWSSPHGHVSMLCCFDHALDEKSRLTGLPIDRYEPLLIPTLHSDVTIAIEIALYTLAGQGREWVAFYEPKKEAA